MGIIPAAAFEAVARFAAESLLAPLPVALAAVLAVATVVGLGLYGRSPAPVRPCIGPATVRRSAAGVVALPRLALRAPDTRSPQPAAAPAVAAVGLLRGPPGSDSRSSRAGAAAGLAG